MPSDPAGPSALRTTGTTASPTRRAGAAARRAAGRRSRGVHGPDGYALWRVRSPWDDSGPAGEVQLVEQVTTSPEAYAALWEFLLGMDLTRTATAWACALDEPLFFMVNEPRRLAARIADALWLRIVDLPAALSARRYATNVDLVFEVTDDVLPGNAGRWRLTGSAEAATCTSTMDEPDLACDIRQLAAAYLGEHAARGLRRGRSGARASTRRGRPGLDGLRLAPTAVIHRGVLTCSTWTSPLGVAAVYATGRSSRSPHRRPVTRPRRRGRPIPVPSRRRRGPRTPRTPRRSNEGCAASSEADRRRSARPPPSGRGTRPGPGPRIWHAPRKSSRSSAGTGCHGTEPRTPVPGTARWRRST